jgi:hypothetical protein
MSGPARWVLSLSSWFAFAEILAQAGLLAHKGSWSEGMNFSFQQLDRYWEITWIDLHTNMCNKGTRDWGLIKGGSLWKSKTLPFPCQETF